MDITVDLGECSPTALRTSVLALTHGHADHIGGLAMYLGVRSLYGMPDPTIITPPGTVAGISDLVDALGRLQRKPFNARIVAAPAFDETLDLDNGLRLGTFRVNHYPDGLADGLACGYLISRVTRRLRSDFIGLPGSVIAQARLNDPGIVTEDVLPLVAVTGDTTPEWIASAPDDVLNARVLFQECTFLGRGRDSQAAQKGMHTHVDELLKLLSHVRSRAIVLYHVSQYYRPEDARDLIDAAFVDAAGPRIHLFDMGNRL